MKEAAAKSQLSSSYPPQHSDKGKWTHRIMIHSRMSGNVARGLLTAHLLLSGLTLRGGDGPVLCPLRSVAPSRQHVLTGRHAHVHTHSGLLSLHLGYHLGDAGLLGNFLANILGNILNMRNLHPRTFLHGLL